MQSKRGRTHLVCVQCGNPFSVYNHVARNNGTKYCSFACFRNHFPDAISKFWGKVNKTDSCWIWTGYAHKGYGRYIISNKNYPQLKGEIRSHRVSWILSRGPIPEGKSVLHKCPSGSNSMCVNPDHLYIGTQLENMRDASREGVLNTPRGERQGNSKLTKEQVIEIRKSYVPFKVTAKMLSKKFGVCDKHISRIIRREWWTHV